MRTETSTFPLEQSAGDVNVHLDGDALCWAWTPNRDEDQDGFRIDLGPRIAELVGLGRGRPMPPQPTWDADPYSYTVMVALNLGTEGTATIAGTPISELAALQLVTAGLYWSMGDGADLIASLIEAREARAEAVEACAQALAADDADETGAHRDAAIEAAANLMASIGRHEQAHALVFETRGDINEPGEPPSTATESEDGPEPSPPSTTEP